MIERAQKLSVVIVGLVRSPAGIIALPAAAKAALIEFAALIVEISERVEKLERNDDGKK